MIRGLIAKVLRLERALIRPAVSVWDWLSGAVIVGPSERQRLLAEWHQMLDDSIVARAEALDRSPPVRVVRQECARLGLAAPPIGVLIHCDCIGLALRLAALVHADGVDAIVEADRLPYGRPAGFLDNNGRN